MELKQKKKVMEAISLLNDIYIYIIINLYNIYKLI